MIISSQQHDVQMIEKSKFEVRMVLTIRNLQKDNVGTYKCVAKNSLGDVESSIRLYGKCLCNVLWIDFVKNSCILLYIYVISAYKLKFASLWKKISLRFQNFCTKLEVNEKWVSKYRESLLSK